MQRGWLVGVMVGALLAGGAWFLRGQATTTEGDTKEKRLLSTTGSATVRVKPDAARVFFGIETMAKSIKEAREENGKRSAAVVEALNALKVPGMKMKTSDMTVSLERGPRYDDRPPDIVGYRITHTFTVLVENTDAEKLGVQARRILDTALEHGANIVERISFLKQDDKEAKRDALAKAVEDAVGNAKALAKGGKVEIKEAVSINGQPDYYWGDRSQFSNVQIAMPAGGDGSPLVAGDLLITCTVSVSCTY